MNKSKLPNYIISITTTALRNFIFPEIDAYHAIVIKEINVYFSCDPTGDGFFHIYYDGEAPIPQTATGKAAPTNCLFQVQWVAGSESSGQCTKKMNQIVADFISMYFGLTAAAIEISINIEYEVLKTSFDQYGQVEKTFLRSFGAQ